MSHVGGAKEGTIDGVKGANVLLQFPSRNFLVGLAGDSAKD